LPADLGQRRRCHAGGGEHLTAGRTQHGLAGQERGVQRREGLGAALVARVDVMQLDAGI
jgi:hypothetical protein